MNGPRKQPIPFSPSCDYPLYSPTGISTDKIRILTAPEFRLIRGRRQLKVSFLSIKVTKDGSWGLWTDSTWRFNFSVNGEERSLIRNVNEDDPPYLLNFSFIVDVTAPGSNLTVQVGGKESDWSSSPLPCSILVWNADNNYGIGKHTLYATSQDVSYEVTCRIQVRKGK